MGGGGVLQGREEIERERLLRVYLLFKDGGWDGGFGGRTGCT